MRSGQGIKAAATTRFVAFVVLVLFALAWRAATFGNPTLHVDDQFYALVGQRMHLGLLPYVDIWDRKPFGLFFIYYAISSLSSQPLAYQIAAWLFVSATAYVIYLCGRMFASPTGAVLAGLLYIVALHVSGGEGGQAPVFYNLFVALAALWLLRWMANEPRQPDHLVWLAMGSLGIALTIKQTVVFEAAAMGAFVVWRLWRVQTPWRALSVVTLTAMALGAAPTVVISAFYASLGYFDEFWHAMITSSATKTYPGLAVITARALVSLIELLPLFAPAMLSLVGMGAAMRPFRPFLLAWLISAFVGFLAVPNFYLHYVLPLWVPLCILAGGAFDRRILGPLLGFAISAYAGLHANPFNFEWTRYSRNQFGEVAGAISEMDKGDTLLVFEGPTQLYAATGRRFLSPLVFPMHLNLLSEANTSHVRTVPEVGRLLRERPDVIVLLEQPRSTPENAATWKLVRDFAATHCQRRREILVPEAYRRWPAIIYARCGD